MLIFILLIWGLTPHFAFAGARLLLSCEGKDADTTTGTFTVPDKWEVNWSSPRPLSISVLEQGGTLVAGAKSNLKGSLYLPKGGTYYLRIVSDEKAASAPWRISIVDVSTGSRLAENEGANPAMDGEWLYDVPSSILTSVQVADVLEGKVVDPNINVVKAPPNPAGVTIERLPDELSRAVVLVKGDHGVGTGFLIRKPEGHFVITNLHVLANNSSLNIVTSAG